MAATMDRAIEPNEAEVINWLLDHASADVTAYRLHPIQGLRVVGGCGCGCTTLNFEADEKGAKILADELAVYPDGQQAGLILWGREGKIVSLEVYDFDPGSSHRFPSASNLCTWEDLGRRDLERSNRHSDG
jgi:hypothetical protein